MTPLTHIAGRVTALAGGTPDLSLLRVYDKLSSLPLGKQLFSRGVCLKAPYFASIDPRIEELRPGHCEVRAKKRRSVQNHLGTFHAIAMCNMAELAGGMLTEVSIPSGHRWIPRGMTVEYLAKAKTDLRAIASVEPLPAFDEAADFPVEVKVLDDEDQLVMRALITMRVSPRA